MAGVVLNRSISDIAIAVIAVIAAVIAVTSIAIAIAIVNSWWRSGSCSSDGKEAQLLGEP